MGLNAEQRRRFEELSLARKMRARALAVERIKSEMRDEIRDFDKRYAFADEAVSDRLKKTISGLPYRRPGTIDFTGLEHKEITPETAENRRVWFCSLCGSEEIFDVFVSGELGDFLRDYDDWYFYGAYMLLMFEDFGGFVYIDDNGRMTEAFLTRHSHTSTGK